MAGDRRAEQLQGLLRASLTTRLGQDGWRPFELPEQWTLAFTRPRTPELPMTAEVWFDFGEPEIPVVVRHATVGVAYEPLLRLAPLFGDRFGLAVIQEHVISVGGDDEPPVLTTVSHERDLPSVSDEVARRIDLGATTFAAQYTKLDDLLDAHGAGDPEEMTLMVAKLLAAGRRFDEARAAIDDCQARAAFDDCPHELDTRDRRVVRQLQRWIDSGGDEALLRDLEQEPRPMHEKPDLREIWHDARAEQDAVKAVKADARGRSRDELRARLEAELTRRDVQRDPLWFERRLDELEDKASQPSVVDTLRFLGTAGRGIARFLRGDVPDIPRPPWLEPPDRAGYRVEHAPTERRVAVTLDPQATPVLQRARAEAATVLGTTSFEVWLDRGDDDHTFPRLIAHLGEHAVGTIDGADADALAFLMEAAARRDEVPCLRGTLNTITSAPGYMLQIQVPKR